MESNKLAGGNQTEAPLAPPLPLLFLVLPPLHAEAFVLSLAHPPTRPQSLLQKKYQPEIDAMYAALKKA